MTKDPTSMRLSEEAKLLLRLIAAKYGLTMSGAFELIVREAAEQKGIDTKDDGGK